MNTSYDYIIAGAGAAGLSLAVQLVNNGVARHKTILLADREEKNRNDRTWCFWEKEAGPFEPVVYKQWNHLVVDTGKTLKLCAIAPYAYKMIRGMDFYRYCHEQLAREKNITRITGEITAIENNGNGASVTVNGTVFTAAYVFSSILTVAPQVSYKQHYLLQHFKGWIIETGPDCFDADAAVFMDFRIPQKNDTRFVYVLPFSANKALVEYTVFSKDIIPDEEYDAGLKEYIRQYITGENYQISDTEKGVIPMTDYRFPRRDGNVFYMGTAGGNTRGSSGFTFKNIQKHTAAIAEKLKHNEIPEVNYVMNRRAAFYDSILLGVLDNHYCAGKTVFTRLFRKRKTVDILSFLDGNSSFFTELKMITAEPKWPFIKSAFRYLFK